VAKLFLGHFWNARLIDPVNQLQEKSGLSGVLPHDTRSYSAFCGDSLPQNGTGLVGLIIWQRLPQTKAPLV
jgi:hypothetical protein